MATILEHIGALETYVARQGASLTRAALPDGVHARISTDRIVLRAGLTPEQELLGLVHELTHWLVHREAAARLGRTVCEYEAEAVETLVLSRLGLNCPQASTPWNAAHLHEECAPTDHLLAASVVRVRWVSARLCEALGLAP